MSGGDVVPVGALRTDADVLRYLGLDPAQPATVALFALAARYGLDPLLRQVEVLPTKQGPRAYISRDGYLALAHRTRELRGIRTVEASEGEHGWRATVEVRTVDGGEFTDSAGCAFDERPTGTQRDGPACERMAIARAERRALKRAFSALPAQQGDDLPEHAIGDPSHVDAYVSEIARSGSADPTGHLPSGTASSPSARGDHGRVPPTTDHERQRAARLAFNALSEPQRDYFAERHGLTDLGAPWPPEALDELLVPGGAS